MPGIVELTESVPRHVVEALSPGQYHVNPAVEILLQTLFVLGPSLQVTLLVIPTLA